MAEEGVGEEVEVVAVCKIESIENPDAAQRLCSEKMIFSKTCGKDKVKAGIYAIYTKPCLEGAIFEINDHYC